MSISDVMMLVFVSMDENLLPLIPFNPTTSFKSGKPNAALTVLDFAVRHGALDSDHDHFIEVGALPV